MATQAQIALETRVLTLTGGCPLSGRIQVQGSKNIALHLYAAALLATDPVVLHNAPDIIDTQVCARILTRVGANARVRGGRFEVVPAERWRPVVDLELGRRVRTTVVLAAAVLACAGRVELPLPGGDAFCPRLIDRHLAALEAAGAAVTHDASGIRAAFGAGGPRPFRVDVNTPYGPSLGATVTALLLASRAPGPSLITSPSSEPEVTATARFLTTRGVQVQWDKAGLHVQGTDRIHGGDFTIAGDRIEAATLIAAVTATGGRIDLDGIVPAELPDGLRDLLAQTGIAVTARPGGLAACRAADGLRSASAATAPHPGLPTDTAPQLAAMLTQADGLSTLDERVYTRRDTHVQGLRAFGADICATGPTIRIRGGIRLREADVEAHDIRAVTSLVIAALVADGTSTIRGMYHLARGYVRLVPNLRALGAVVTTTAEDR